MSQAHLSAQPQLLPSQHPLFLIYSGAISGIIGTTFIFPLDIVKTRLQQDVNKFYRNSGFFCAQHIIRNEGFFKLYRGLAVNLIGVAPEKALKLTLNDVFRRKLQGNDSTLSLEKQVLAGAGAGFGQVICTNPMELTKIFFQLEKVKQDEAKKKGLPPPEPLKVTNVVKMAGGVRGLYKGTAATLLRDVPFSMIYFPLYAYLKIKFADSKGEIGSGRVLGASCIAGAFAASLVTPADVIKTRLQEPGSKYKTLAQALQGTLATDGPAALMKGWKQRALIISPLFGVALVVFEFHKKIIDAWWLEKQKKK